MSLSTGNRSRRLTPFSTLFSPGIAARELPRYSAQLKTLQTELADGTLTPQSWRHHVDMARDHWFRLFAQVFDDLLPLIASLSDKQVAQVIAKLEADEQELVDEYKDKNQEQLIKDADERLEELFCRLAGAFE